MCMALLLGCCCLPAHHSAFNGSAPRAAGSLLAPRLVGRLDPRLALALLAVDLGAELGRLAFQLLAALLRLRLGHVLQGFAVLLDLLALPPRPAPISCQPLSGVSHQVPDASCARPAIPSAARPCPRSRSCSRPAAAAPSPGSSPVAWRRADRAGLGHSRRRPLSSRDRSADSRHRFAPCARPCWPWLERSSARRAPGRPRSPWRSPWRPASSPLAAAGRSRATPCRRWSSPPI